MSGALRSFEDERLASRMSLYLDFLFAPDESGVPTRARGCPARAAPPVLFRGRDRRARLRRRAVVRRTVDRPSKPSAVSAPETARAGLRWPSSCLRRRRYGRIANFPLGLNV